MYSALEDISHQGIALYLDGQLATPEEIANRHFVNEQNIYMPDYVINNTGELVELRFDRIDAV